MSIETAVLERTEYLQSSDDEQSLTIERAPNPEIPTGEEMDETLATLGAEIDAIFTHEVLRDMPTPGDKTLSNGDSQDSDSHE
jgi:hypothetical protein